MPSKHWPTHLSAFFKRISDSSNSQNFTLFFIPKEWQETVSAPGHLLLAGLILFDLLGTRAPLIGGKVDNLAHLGGILVGVLWATAYKRQEKERFGKMSWFERLFWGESK